MRGTKEKDVPIARDAMESLSELPRGRKTNLDYLMNVLRLQ